MFQAFSFSIIEITRFRDFSVSRVTLSTRFNNVVIEALWLLDVRALSDKKTYPSGVNHQSFSSGQWRVCEDTGCLRGSPSATKTICQYPFIIRFMKASFIEKDTYVFERKLGSPERQKRP